MSKPGRVMDVMDVVDVVVMRKSDLKRNQKAFKRGNWNMFNV